MARPKLGISDTERLHVKITKDEMDAIDTWRHENSIPSRSEAVRRLCQTGMTSAATIEAEQLKLEAKAKVALQLSDQVEELERKLADALRGNRYAQLERIAAKRIEELELENERLTEKAIVGEYMWTPAEMQEVIHRAETAEAQTARAIDLLRQSRNSLKQAPFNLFMDMDAFLAQAEPKQENMS